MMHKAKVAVCSEIRTKQSTQSQHRVEFFNVKPGGHRDTFFFATGGETQAVDGQTECL